MALFYSAGQEKPNGNLMVSWLHESWPPNGQLVTEEQYGKLSISLSDESQIAT